MKSIRLLAIAALVAAIAFIGGTSATAAPVDIDNAAVTGVLSLNRQEPGDLSASFTGTWDDETGDFSGDLTIPDGTIAVTDPIAVTIHYRITNPGGFTGNVPVDGTAGEVTGNFQLELLRLDPPLLEIQPCVFRPIELTLTASLGDDGIISLADPDFTIPPTEDSCGGLASTVNERVAGSGNAVTLDVDPAITAEPPVDTTSSTLVTDTTMPDETTTTGPPSFGPGGTAPGGTAPGATPVRARPAYTG